LNDITDPPGQVRFCLEMIDTGPVLTVSDMGYKPVVEDGPETLEL
jgi:hypothetical protein